MEALAVLISGGLDSAILLGDVLRLHPSVFPLYIRCGLYWEAAELDALAGYLDAVRCPALGHLAVLDQPVADLYRDHWSITGKGVPDANTADEAVYLPGRNVLLISKALLWCHLHRIPALALGSLGTNPFPDAQPSFFKSLQDVLNQSVAGHVTLRIPFAGMEKTAVMRLGAGLPLEFTFSCIHPNQGGHCGQCNKCAERRRAFVDAGRSDLTAYANVDESGQNSSSA